MSTTLPGSVNLGYATFNGWQIVSMPSLPVAKEIDFSMNDSVGEVTSPFTLSSQQQYWAGGDFWKLNVSLPPMKKSLADAWVAWFGALRGKTNVFQIGDPSHVYPSTYQLISSLAPVTDGQNNATSVVLTTRGWTPNVAALNPGDYLQIGYRLHMVVGTQTCVADADGKCSFEIWPSLRESPTDGTAVNFVNTQGLFRLQDNERQFSAIQNKIYTLSFKAIEAR